MTTSSWGNPFSIASGPQDAPLPTLGGVQPIGPSSGTIDGRSWGSFVIGTTQVMLLNQGGAPGLPAVSNGLWIYQGPGVPMSRPLTGFFSNGSIVGGEFIFRVSAGTMLAHTEWAIVQGGTVGTSPLQIEPGTVVRSAPLSVSSGVNPVMAVGPSNVISITAPLGDFTITGLPVGWEGREVTLINPTGYTMTIKHQDGTVPPGNAIMCATGTDLVLPCPPGGFSFCRLTYCTLLSAPGVWLAMDSSPPATVQPPPWVFLPEAVLCLRSDVGVGVSAGTVTSWADQSGAGNSVSIGATAASGPAYSASGGPNGFPTLSGFSQTAYLDNTTNNPVPSGADRTVLFVGQAASTGGDYFTFRLGTNGNTQTVACFTYLSIGGAYYCWTDAVSGANNETFPGSSFVAGSPVVIIAIYEQGALLRLRVNGTPVSVTGGGGALSADTGPNGFSIGVCEAFTSPAWDGSILEEHVCAVQLTVAQCQQFESYAAARYGIML